MKRKPRITAFAKLVIAALIFFGLRYAYIHKDEILSSDFLNFTDTIDQELNEIDTVTKLIDEKTDTETVIKKDTTHIITDTLEIIIERSNELILLKSSGYSVNILLKDSLIDEDTIPFKAFEDKHIFGRVIIK